MKRMILIVLIFCVVFGAGLSAQGLRFGVKGALVDGNYTGIEWKDLVQDYRDAGYHLGNALSLGFSGGVMFDIPVSNRFSIELDVLGTLTNTKVDWNTGSDYWMSDRQLILDIPLYGKIYLSNSTNRFFVGAGPNFQMNIGEVTTTYDDGDTYNYEVDNTFVKALSLTFGVEFPASKGNSTGIFDLRYAYNFDEWFEDYYQNSLFALELGILF